MGSDFSLNNFVYFQVNNGSLCFLGSVEEIHTVVLSVLVSILDPNHTYFPLLLDVTNLTRRRVNEIQPRTE